jgi:deoxycytidylate deaminase
MAIYNAIIEGKVDRLKGGSIYVNLFPCNQCMQQIALYNLSALYYDSDKYHDSIFSKEARIIINELTKICDFQVKQVVIDDRKLTEYKKLLEEENEKINC